MSGKKIVLKVNLHDDKAKQKALKAVSSVVGVDSLSMDMKDQKLTIIGDVDPVELVAKLKKKCYTEIVTVGPAKEPEKKEEPKKELAEAKKEETKKEDPPKKELTDEQKKKKTKEEEEEEQIAALVKAYQAYNPWLTQHYHVVSCEENPNACVII